MVGKLFAAASRNCLYLQLVKVKTIILSAAILVAAALPGRAQNVRRITGTPMYYSVGEQGDTVFHDTLDPVWVFPKGKGMKSGDVDPRCREEYCYTASDKALAVGGGVLEALLHFRKYG